MSRNTYDSNHMLKSIRVNGDEYGLDLGSLGDQEKIFVKSAAKTYEMRPEGDEMRLYDTDIYNSGMVGNPLGSGNEPDGFTKAVGSSYITNMVKINSVFFGGSATANDIPAATHSYVELANALKCPMSLNNMALLYIEPGGSAWKSIRLQGSIPSGSTFLIRGAEVGVPSNRTLSVDSYDMIWRDERGEPIRFSDSGGTFYLCYCKDDGTIADKVDGKVTYVSPESFSLRSPYYEGTSNILEGYIDCFGAAVNGVTPLGEPSAIVLPEGVDIHRTIFMRYWSLDSCSKTNKAWDSRKESTFWTYCNFDKNDTAASPYWNTTLKSQLGPMASYLHKNFLTNKRHLREDKPNCISLTFGMRGTASTSSSKDSTRCITWNSVGYYDEFVEYRKKGGQDWKRLYSIDKKDYSLEDGEHYGSDQTVSTFIDVYSRWMRPTIGGRLAVTHRTIIKGLGAGEYEYRVGRIVDGEVIDSYYSPVMSFKVKTDADVNGNGFKFIQTTDQQGYSFNEYVAWKKAAYAIYTHSKDTSDPDHSYGWDEIDFTVNTGDASQNGNRENEWLDYFDGKGKLNDIPEMLVVGNNDLGGDDIGVMYDDGNTNQAKINSWTIWAYYTFEFDVNNTPYFRFYPNPDGTADLDPAKVGKWVLRTGKDSAGKSYIEYFMPSVYTFTYGDYRFLALNSEFSTNIGVYKMYYDDPDLNNSDSPKYQAFLQSAYYNEYQWMKKVVDGDGSGNYHYIAMMHELPFCISPIAAKGSDIHADKRVIKGGMSKLNYDFSTYTKYARGSDDPDAAQYTGGACYSEFFQRNGVRLALGGHKHTYSLSYPIFENVSYDGGVRSVKMNEPIVMKDDGSYVTRVITASPTSSKWYDETVATAPADEKPVVYAMCQATGYKLESNNDKPGEYINWLKYYYPCKGTSVSDAKTNTDQYWAMFNLMNCSDSKVILTSYRVLGPNTSSVGSTPKKTFDINNTSMNQNTTPEALIISEDKASNGGEAGTFTSTITW